MIQKVILNITITILMSISLFGFDDLDFDGVEDKYDMCPQSLFSDLVDKNGCKVKSIFIQDKHNFDISITISDTKGYDYEYFSNTISASYSYKDISLSLSNSYYKYELPKYGATFEGQGDYHLGLNYKLLSKGKFSLSMKPSVVIPFKKEKNKEIDFTLSVSSNYKITNKLNFFNGYTYYFINDKNNNDVKYSNYYAFNMGSKYNVALNTYASLHYSHSVDGDDTKEDSKTLFFSVSYYFNNGIYTIIDVGQALIKDPFVSNSFKVGYFF